MKKEIKFYFKLAYIAKYTKRSLSLTLKDIFEHFSTEKKQYYNLSHRSSSCSIFSFFRGLGDAVSMLFRCINLNIYVLDPLKFSYPKLFEILMASSLTSVILGLVTCLSAHSLSFASNSGQYGVPCLKQLID